MARGDNHNRGRGGVPRGSPYRGQGPYRGRGTPPSGRGRGGQGRGRGARYRSIEDVDLQVQMYTNVTTQERGSPIPRGYKRGGAGLGTISPRGRGYESGRTTPRGFGRGSGRGHHKFNRFNPDTPLSKMLDLDRPLLRPIAFVPAKLTPILFQEEEEIFQVKEDDLDNENHVPTADRVTRIFSGQTAPPESQSDTEDGELEQAETSGAEESLVTVDFNSLGDFLKSSYAVEAAELPQPTDSAQIETVQNLEVTESTQLTESAILESSMPVIPAVESANEQIQASTEQTPGFFIDVTPSLLSNRPESTIAFNPTSHHPLGSNIHEEDEEVIVYVAPHPRSGRIAPVVSQKSEPISASPLTVPPLASSSILPPTTAQSNIPSPPSFDSLDISFHSIAAAMKQSRKVKQFAVAPRSRRLTKKDRKVARRRMERDAMFGSFGAIREEMALQDDSRMKSRDPRRDEQRRGDSDVDWGDEVGDKDVQEDETDDDVDAISNVVGAMDLDPDLEIDGEAFKNFAKGLSGVGGIHVSIDDLADAEEMKLEDEEDEEANSTEGSSHDDEIDGILEVEGNLLVGEVEVDEVSGAKSGNEEGEGSESDDDDDFSSSEEITPKRGFQARLEKMRRNTQGKGKAATTTLSSDDDSSEDGSGIDRDFTWADDDEDFIAGIQAILKKNEHILGSRDQKQKKALFLAIQDGDFDSDLDMLTPAKRKRDKNIPANLQDQWEKDRAKKAENKKKRARARLAAASDPLVQHKKGKKGRKAMLKAAIADDSDFDMPGRITDLPSLVTQIRAFTRDLDRGGGAQMALPPMAKETRANVHQLALAFGLKSKSLGKGKARYTTLIKTTRSGVRVDEAKVERILRRGHNDGGFVKPYERGAKGKGTPMPRHRDGDEVGKAAPKIGEHNIGFKMLASMGWADGDRIGVSGGLDAPLTAIIKNTKLGLGAR